jgi:hypothetical protein
MEDNKPPHWIFGKIAKEIHQEVPDGTDKPAWGHGSYKVIGNIDGYCEWQFEQGIVPSDIDLTNIRYVIFWRQAVPNKKTKEVKAFASWTGGGAQSVVPGQTITVDDGKYITIGTSNEEIERLAKDALINLQKMVKKYYKE